MAELSTNNNKESDIRKKNSANRKKVMDKTLADIAASVTKISDFQLTHRRKLTGHCDKVFCCVWSPQPRRLLSASLDGKLIVWDTGSRNKVHAITNDCTWIMSCAFGPNSEDLIACGGLDNKITIYKFNAECDQYSLKCRLEGHEGYISSCNFLDENRFLSSSGDQTCCLWDVSNHRSVVTFSGHSRDVVDLSRSSDESTFLTASADKSVMMWDVRKKNPVRSFEGHSADVSGVKYFPNEMLFGTVSEDGTSGLWDIRSDQRVGTYSAPDGVLFTSLDFSKSGRVVFFGSDNCNVYCFDVLAEAEICSLKWCHSDCVKKVGVSPQGDALFTASWDSTIRIWN